jgi:hypothetical protein
LICDRTEKVGDLGREKFLFYGNGLLNALKNVAAVNMNKVTLELRIKVGGKMGVLFVTEGTAESHLKVGVKCSFPENKEMDKSESG